MGGAGRDHRVLFLFLLMGTLVFSSSPNDSRRSESDVAQSCLSLCNPMDCSLPGSSIHGIFQARVLAWVAISFSRGSSRPRDWTQVSRVSCRQTLYHSDPPGKRDCQIFKPRCNSSAASCKPALSSMTDLDLLGITWSKQITWKMWLFKNIYIFFNLWLSMHKMKFIIFKCTIH